MTDGPPEQTVACVGSGLIDRWVQDAWSAWSRHHPAVRARADELAARHLR